jgi:uracil-DNA glycosylase family 4
MNNIAQKLEYIKWLKSIGIEYYFSTKKDSDISLINELKGHYNKKQEIGSDTIMVNESTKFHTAEKLTVINNNDVDKEVSSVKEARSLADSISSLDKLKEIVANFNGCTLKNFALNTVFADGNPGAKIMLIGEAPGAKEDELGIPFCGESGMLLDIMLSTVKLSRKENIYITNTVFWRPPANRKPTKQEINICQPFLEKHIALINPKLIICVGSTAVTGLFGDKTSINTARDTKHFYQNNYLPQPITTMAIFHPAYLLRQPAKKKDTWFDLIKIQQFIEETI